MALATVNVVYETWIPVLNTRDPVDAAYGVVGKAMEGYFKKVNDEGGINGRKINFISYDDAYSPPKAVEQTRKLVESDEVLLVFGALGTPSNSATILRAASADCAQVRMVS